MKTPNYNKGATLYNVVYGVIEYNPPDTIYDYESMYSLISPFILTREKFEEGVKESILTTRPVLPVVTLDTDSKVETNQEMNDDTLSSYLLPEKKPPQNTITISFNDPPSLHPPQNRPSATSSIKTVLPSHQPDPLFWNIYVAINGTVEYQYLNGKYTNFITDEKQKIVNYISAQVALKTPQIKIFMKLNKMSGVSIKELLSGILSNQPITFKDISIYCFFYKINITFINREKRMYFVVEGKTEEQTSSGTGIYIEFSILPPRPSPHLPTATVAVKNYKYTLITEDALPRKQTELTEQYYKLENLTKPFGAISSYKVEELKAIAEKLNIVIDTDSKVKKNDLYNMIDEKIKEVV